MRLLHGDCLEIMPTLDECSVDTIITDPPYGLTDLHGNRAPQYGSYDGDWQKNNMEARGGFMGMKWDHGVPDARFWREALRVAKPGATLLAMGGTRTFHRLVCAIEDAGWEVRDTIAWLYGSGFPKSFDIGKGMDKAQGAEREKVVGKWAERYPNGPQGNQFSVGDNPDGSRTGTPMDTLPATPEAQQWDGWGTALKPAMELICVAQKPREGTYVENALKYGVAGLWIDGGRVGYASDDDKDKALAGDAFKRKDTSDKGWSRPWMEDPERVAQINAEAKERAQNGRFPANVIHDGSDEVLRGFPETAASKASMHGAGGGGDKIQQLNYRKASIRGHNDNGGSAARYFYQVERDEMGWISIKTKMPETSDYYLVYTKINDYGEWDVRVGYFIEPDGVFVNGKHQDILVSHWMVKPDGPVAEGSPGRFLYTAKASRSERNAGLEGMEEKDTWDRNSVTKAYEGLGSLSKPMSNHHPTVKPLALMEYLVRLTKTPTGGVVLDPFMGSGTTGIACVNEGREFIGIEMSDEYLEIARRRIEYAEANKAPVQPVLFGNNGHK